MWHATAKGVHTVTGVRLQKKNFFFFPSSTGNA